LGPAGLAGLFLGGFAMSKYVLVDDERTGRLKSRTISLEYIAGRVRQLASERKRDTFFALHGGTVCNTYGYRAETECAVAVALYTDSGITVAIFAAQIPANKATMSGVARACLPVAMPIFDDRYSSGKKLEARKAAIEFVKSELEASR